MKYLLIVIIYFTSAHGGGGGVTNQAIKFKTLEDCRAAEKVYRDWRKDGTIMRLRTACFRINKTEGGVDG